MPTYDYRCEKCGDFEYVQKITDNPLTACPTCGGVVTRLISATAFHLKGSGWYKTDYASGSGKSNGSGTPSSAPDTTTGDNKTKPESKADSSAVSGSTSATPASSKTNSD